MSFCLCFPQASAWQTDGTPICTGNASQGYLHICADGSGGAVLSWSDNRTGTGPDLYSQRVDSSGNTLWIANGTLLCNAASWEISLRSCYDGTGGYIFTWQDNRSSVYDIYAQKLNATGAPQWDANGTLVCNAAEHQLSPQIASDGQGNAYIAWMDRRQDGTNHDIYVQKLNSTGHLQWTPNGTAVSNLATFNAQWPRIDCDSSGNLFVAWDENRGISNDIYAQKLNSSGAPEWGANGTAICDQALPQSQPILCADGFGGAIIAWTDYRSTSVWEMYVQKINYLGIETLTTNGIPLGSGSEGDTTPEIISDGAGGAIIVWSGKQSGQYDIVGQKINVAGVLQWGSSGLVICGVTDKQFFPEICPDGAGGVIATWEDERSGSHKDIYAQKVKSDGTLAWTTTGTSVCVATDNQFTAVLAGDGSGNAIIAWRDNRTGTERDVYAQRVSDPSNDNGIPGFALLYVSIGLLALIAIYHRKKLF